MSKEQSVKERAKHLLKKLVTGILKLEDAAEGASKSSQLHKLLEDVATNQWQISREIYVRGIEVDWDPEDRELRAIAFSLFAGPSTTKNCLENVLSTVKDAGTRVSKNSMNMSIFAKWTYAATSSYSEEGGVSQLQLDLNDFVEAASLVPVKAFFASKVWDQGSSTFHHIIPGPEEVHAEIRKAGYHANKQSAAACAYILLDTDNDFLNVSKVWSGHGESQAKFNPTTHIVLQNVFVLLPNH